MGGDHEQGLPRVPAGAFGEPSIAGAKAGESYQFERLGYFVRDSAEGRDSAGRPVFNRSVNLRDTWAKIEKKGSAS